MALGVRASQNPGFRPPRLEGSAKIRGWCTYGLFTFERAAKRSRETLWSRDTRASTASLSRDSQPRGWAVRERDPFVARLQIYKS